MGSHLIEDIKKILENGPVAITDLQKQLKGINITIITRTWYGDVSPKIADFADWLEDYNFTVTERFTKKGRPSGLDVSL